VGIAGRSLPSLRLLARGNATTQERTAMASALRNDRSSSSPSSVPIEFRIRRKVAQVSSSLGIDTPWLEIKVTAAPLLELHKSGARAANRGPQSPFFRLPIIRSIDGTSRLKEKQVQP